MSHWADFLLMPKPLLRQYIVEDSTDWWTCRCGNQPHYEGFFTCTETGKIIPPSTEEGWDEVHYVCHRCWRIIDQNSLEIVGVCSTDVRNHNTEFNWDNY